MRKLVLNNRGFNLVEMLMAVTFSVLLLTAVYSFYNVASQDYNAGISTGNLQNAANTIISKIIEGDTESGVVYRLATGVSYMIPNGTANYMYTCGGIPQAAACNTTNTFGELYYCQDSPCTNTDTTARWYYLNSAGSSIMYHYPNEANNQDTILYTAPAGSTIQLRFSNPYTNVVEIDVDLSKILAGNLNNLRMKTSGNVSTYVLLRNHS